MLEIYRRSGALPSRGASKILQMSRLFSAQTADETITILLTITASNAVGG
jgi:hypothetical protein